ncbi:hypothetical protein ACFWOJ_12980 [Streptomyces sp. NPDC058439]|uniref:Gfo/Idh/MocA family protein n=1 Tax=Streptomyces sp. NPDC058439 TaxID=3346500 RepID=UPI00365C0578
MIRTSKAQLEPAEPSALQQQSGWIGGATYDDRHAYVLDVTSGATLLSIPFGHSVDALTMVLGEFREVSALVENLRPEVTHVTSGAVTAKSAEDQIAVTGVLESGAVAAMHIRGGTSRATAFHWEINGTEGDLVVKADQAQWWYGGCGCTAPGARTAPWPNFRFPPAISGR